MFFFTTGERGAGPDIKILELLAPAGQNVEFGELVLVVDRKNMIDSPRNRGLHTFPGQSSHFSERTGTSIIFPPCPIWETEWEEIKNGD